MKHKEGKLSKIKKSQIAQIKPRDADGHFLKISTPSTSSSQTSKSAKVNPVTQFISQNVGVNKTAQSDDIIDVEVRNPFKKIYAAILDIKKQKALSFTFKGSLSIIGILLALSLFGFFGGSHLLCDKGTQTEIGVVRVLPTQEPTSSQVPFVGSIIDAATYLFSPTVTAPNARTVLIKPDESTIDLTKVQSINFTTYNNQKVIVTGQLDSCESTLKPDPDGVVVY